MNAGGGRVPLDGLPAPLLEVRYSGAHPTEVLVAPLPGGGTVRALLGENLHVVKDHLPPARHGRDHVALNIQPQVDGISDFNFRSFYFLTFFKCKVR